ncbi:MAG: hypothetical protein EBQ85_01750, partial [Proteobacteria bacterium]|nr:hypothetical protein [Pseudomonadota bacterium]
MVFFKAMQWAFSLLGWENTSKPSGCFFVPRPLSHLFERPGSFFSTSFHDLNTYLIHRMQHSFHFLWKTHEAHHSTPEVDWLSGIRSSAVEILIYES